MKTYGLLGYPLGHSFSRSFFTEKFEKEDFPDCRYENFSFENIDEGVLFLKKLDGLCGLNVTIPHKLQILPHLDEMSTTCEIIQSCNCIQIENGKWTGHNTDVTGFSKSLSPLIRDKHQKAVIFGTGGASKAVAHSLSEMGIDFTMVSRTKGEHTLSYDEITGDIIADHHLLINTTPVGMFPHVDESIPIAYDAITKDHLAYDLIYNPEETLFLKRAKEQGAAIKNGHEMLIIQAEESWKIWNS